MLSIVTEYPAHGFGIDRKGKIPSGIDIGRLRLDLRRTIPSSLCRIRCFMSGIQIIFTIGNKVTTALPGFRIALLQQQFIHMLHRDQTDICLCRDHTLGRQSLSVRIYAGSDITPKLLVELLICRFGTVFCNLIIHNFSIWSCIFIHFWIFQYNQYGIIVQDSICGSQERLQRRLNYE